MYILLFLSISVSLSLSHCPLSPPPVACALTNLSQLCEPMCGVSSTILLWGAASKRNDACHPRRNMQFHPPWRTCGGGKRRSRLIRRSTQPIQPLSWKHAMTCFNFFVCVRTVLSLSVHPSFFPVGYYCTACVPICPPSTKQHLSTPHFRTLACIDHDI